MNKISKINSLNSSMHEYINTIRELENEEAVNDNLSIMNLLYKYKYKIITIIIFVIILCYNFN